MPVPFFAKRTPYPLPRKLAGIRRRRHRRSRRTSRGERYERALWSEKAGTRCKPAVIGGAGVGTRVEKGGHGGHVTRCGGQVESCMEAEGNGDKRKCGLKLLSTVSGVVLSGKVQAFVQESTKRRAAMASLMATARKNKPLQPEGNLQCA